jgi:hypothetical protein
LQDRYAGDIGDFAKFAILRGLLRSTDLRLGLVWCLTSHSSDPQGDGRHVDYLQTDRGRLTYRQCDPHLYDCLAAIVRSGARSVAAFPNTGVLPEDSVYVDRLLTYDDMTLRDRQAVRTSWLNEALQTTANCDVVMFDPDNGLEVPSTPKYRPKGTKYIFFDELREFVCRGQTVIVYQHSTRAGDLATQTSERLTELNAKLPLQTQPFALLWRRVSARSFLIAPTAKHARVMNEQAQGLVTGPLGGLVTRISSAQERLPETR